MAHIEVKPLRDDLPFGSRVGGVTHAMLADDAVRAQLNDLFDDRGLIVFEDVDPTSQMHMAISNVFGPLKDHPVPSVARVNQDAMPGVIDMRSKDATTAIVEIEGKSLASWLPWHFDHCYNNELNRAGVLRALEVAETGGLTGFTDGVALYEDISPELREQIEGLDILYHLDLDYADMRFGKPKTFRITSPKRGDASFEYGKTMPRALHPAVWKRESGEKVLHISPWFAVGIDGRENTEGDALLEAVCQEIAAKAKPYLHQWNLSDMLIWDNWRVLHMVSGMTPGNSRHMQRTTIKGDYGLGRFENGAVGDARLEMTV